jgi:ribosomal protein S18 acetylase RimI-like enzyme
VGNKAALKVRVSTFSSRIATLADIERVAPLFDDYRQFYGMAPDRALAERYLRERLENNESVVLLATDPKQAALGFCQLYPTFCSVEAKPIYTLYDLYVAPAARRLGVGRFLLLAAEQLARENGKARMDLSTAKTNHSAQRLYESLGWVQDAVFLVYSRHIEIPD